MKIVQPLTCLITTTKHMGMLPLESKEASLLRLWLFSSSQPPNQNEKSLSFYKGRSVELNFRRIEFNTQLSKNRVALLFNPSSSFDPLKTISIPTASALPDSTPARFIFDSYVTRLSESRVCITAAQHLYSVVNNTRFHEGRVIWYINSMSL